MSVGVGEDARVAERFVTGGAGDRRARVHGCAADGVDLSRAVDGVGEGRPERAVVEFVIEFLPEALADASPYLKMHHQRGIVAGIAAGSAEIQLNIIATEVLELPREPR